MKSFALVLLLPERARYVAMEEWHPKQRTSWKGDGSYILEVPYCSEAELVMDIVAGISGNTATHKGIGRSTGTSSSGIRSNVQSKLFLNESVKE